MSKQSILLVSLGLVLVLFMAGCSTQPDPETVYWQYWEACSQGKFNEAVEFLSVNAREAARSLGSCGFTHDAINTIEAASGNPPRTFSEDPEITILETRSMVTWIDDQGNIAAIILVMEEGSWKISEATWSK